MHKAFNSNRHKRADFWKRSAIHLAVVLLKDRQAMMGRLEEAEFNIYERVSGELLSRTIWKYSEAFGKTRGNAFWSQRALNHFLAGGSSKELRHEHVFPQNQLIEMMRELEDPDDSDIQQLFSKYAIGVVLLKDEDTLLAAAGRKLVSVEGGLLNPWLRYDLGTQRIIVVEHEGIPSWHAARLHEAKLFGVTIAEAYSSDSNERQPNNRSVKRVNDEGDKGKGPRRYYDGPFPTLDTKLRIVATSNPKRKGTAARARFDAYLRANPTTVREFLAAGGQRVDIRYDLHHNYIELDPDPRR